MTTSFTNTRSRSRRDPDRSPFRRTCAGLALLAWVVAGCASPTGIATLDLDGDAIRCYTASGRVTDVRGAPGGDGILVATWGGLLHYDPDGRLRRRTTRCDGLIGHTLEELAVTADGEVWIATAQGVSRLHAGGVSGYGTREGLNDDRAYAVAVDGTGRLFVGTHRGVNRFDGERFVPFNDTHEFSRRPTYDIHAARDGTLWFAKENALTHYLGDGRWRVFQRDPVTPGPRSDIVSNTVRQVVTDERGDPWIGTPRGLGHFDGSSWTHLFHNPRHGILAGLRDSRVDALALDSNGALWVGHGDADGAGRALGVARRDEGGWRYYTERDGLPADRVYRVRAGADGSIWIATRRGAARFEDGSFEVFHTPGELPSNGVRTIVTLEDGRIAVVTRAGVAVFDRGVPSDPPPGDLAAPGDDGAGPHAAGIHPPPGLRDFVARVTARDESGAVWVGTRGHGLLRRNGASWQRVLLGGRPFPREITSLHFEDAKTLWVGTAGEGAFRIAVPAQGDG